MVIGIAAGIALGLLARWLAGGAGWVQWFTENVAATAGQIFLRLLFMLIVPLLFAALVVAIAGLDLRGLVRLGGRTLGYTLILSAAAVVIGMALVNLVRPGEGFPAAPTVSAAVPPPAAPAVEGEGGFVGFLVRLVPDNPVKAAAAGDLIGLIVFSLLFGVGLAATRTAGADRLRELVQGLYDVTMTCIDWVLRLAPVGVGALLFVMAMRVGAELLAQLAAYVGVVLAGMLLHMFVVYPLVLRLLAGKSARWFFRGARLAIATAFSTSSSSATLPTSLRVAEEELALPPAVSRFVLTVGATLNQNGTALFEGITILFLAQLYDVPLSLGQQALVMVISLLAGVGTAGIPAGSLPMMALVLAIFDIPTEGVAIILGVDRFLDMCRTTLNVTGDLVLAVCISGRGSGHTDGERPPPDLPNQGGGGGV
jgi:DAACS family dicarboxylate/amino acid:cation (Na+ or H+) symporter